MNNLLSRTIAGTVYGAVVIGSAFGGIYWFGMVMLVFNAMALLEYNRLIHPEKRALHGVYLIVASLPAYLSLFMLATGSQNLWLFPVFLLSFFLLFVRGFFDKPAPSFATIPSGIAGISYITIPLALLGMFFRLTENREPWFLIALFVLLWIYDCFAYFTGKLAGKTKLCEKISPGKTVEGLAGGTVFTLAAAATGSYVFPVISFSQWIGMAAVIIIFGTFGDLSESLLKRKAGVKDSGKIIPGHGGMLDRIDSVLFAGPAALAYLYLVLNQAI